MEKRILKNYIIYFLFFLLICIIGISDVFAYEYDDVGYFNDKTQVQVEVNYAANPISVPINATYQLEQVYSLDMHVTNINLDPSFVYWFEIYLPNTILSRANAAEVYNQSGNTSTRCDILTTYFGNNYPHVTFLCNSQTNITSLYIRYYNSSNQYLFDPQIFTWNYTYMRKRTNTSEDRTDEIIDNATQNTQDIINNQNQNTQDIIDSQKSCLTIDKNKATSNRYIDMNGAVQTVSGTWGATDFINIKNGTLTMHNIISWSTSTATCFYNNNKVKISCTKSNEISNGNLTIPTNAEYMRMTIDMTNNSPTADLCKNGNQATQDAINGLDDTIKDDDIGDSTQDAADFITDFDTNTFGLTSIITAPLNLIQSLTSSSCTPLNLPLPYLNNKNITLPCMSTIYQQHFGAFFTIYQTITYGIIAYWVCVRVFNQVKDFKNPEHDEIEVVDL